MNVLSLFSGIGGLELGLERAGMTTVGQVEIDPFCRRVMAKHWPEVPRHDDVRTSVEWWRSEPRPPVHVVAEGPHCQPFSRAGAQLGIGDPRWSWPWMLTVVRDLAPRFVIMENVAALLGDGAAWGRILGDLADCGFDAEWSVLSACAFGAPHPRGRVFLVAYPAGQFRPARVAEKFAGVGATVWPPGDGEHAWSRPEVWLEAAGATDRVADGVATRMVAVGGNAVVPQVSEYVGRLILSGGHGGDTSP